MHKFILSTFLLFHAIIISGQEPKLELRGILETRNTTEYLGTTEIHLRVLGLDTNSLFHYHLEEITAAQDDQGHELKSMMNSFYDIYYSIPFFRIRLKSTERQAKKIAFIEGKYSVIKPSIEKGTKIVVKNILTKYNKNLMSTSHPDIQVKLLDEAALKKLQKENMQKYEAELKKAKTSGSFVERIRAGFGELLDETFFGLTASITEEYTLNFYTKQKEETLLRIFIMDSKGSIKGESLISKYYNITDIELDEKPQSDWQMVMVLKDENSTTTYPFRLENIELP